MHKASTPLKVRWEAGLCLLESVHASDFRMPWTVEAFHKVIAPLQGQGRLELRAEGRKINHRLAAGTIALVGAGASHRIKDGDGSPLHLYVLCIAKDFPLPARGMKASAHVCHEAGMVRPGLLVLREIAAAQGPERNLLRLGLTATLVARLLSAQNPAEAPDARERLADFLRRLDTEFYQGRNLDEAAGDTGLSRRRFTQLFIQQTGMTYGAYVRELRINHAKRLLREKGRSPLAAAFECGYEDLSTFYRAFKRQTQMTPTQWTGRKGTGRS